MVTVSQAHHKFVCLKRKILHMKGTGSNNSLKRIFGQVRAPKRSWRFTIANTTTGTARGSQLPPLFNPN